MRGISWLHLLSSPQQSKKVHRNVLPPHSHFNPLFYPEHGESAHYETSVKIYENASHIPKDGSFYTHHRVDLTNLTERNLIFAVNYICGLMSRYDLVTEWTVERRNQRNEPEQPHANQYSDSRIKVKIKFALEEVMKTQRGSGCITLTFL